MEEARPPRPVSAREFDQMSDAALDEHADRINAARRDGIVELAEALADSYADADNARTAENARRRAEWEATPEYAQQQEQKHRNRSDGGRRGWQTRQERKLLRDRERPLGGFGAAGANTPVAVDGVCDESLLRGDDRCPAAVLDLCGGCADGPTREQVDQAVAADRPDAPAQERVRTWLAAAFPTVTSRMVDAATRAHHRYENALNEFHERPGVQDAADTAQLWRRVNPTLYAAQQVAHLPELPNLGEGPRVHAYTHATITDQAQRLLGNLTPTRYELITEDGGTLTEQDPAAPTDLVPTTARRLLAAAHESGLSWDLAVDPAEEAVLLTVRGVGRPGARDAWLWQDGRLDRLHSTGRPLRDAVRALTTN